jgi:hypothetical protein
MDENRGTSVAVAVAVGALIGLVAGIVVSLATSLPFAPEAGLVIGGLIAWAARRNRA